MNELQTFTYNNMQVRTIEINGEPWFVLKDVCDILGLSNPSRVAERLDEDERSNFKLGRQGEVNIISESGLYNVILRSDKPEAKPFRKWVTCEVLPTIRKTGSYNARVDKLEQPAVETSEYCYFPKTFKGEPVITIADFEYFTGISHHNIYKPLKRQCKLGEEYFSLSNAGIAQYKRENPGVSRLQSVALVLKESAVRKLLSYFKLSVKIPMIEEKKEKPVIKPATANVDECIITLGVLGVVRDNLKKSENREAEEAVNVAIKYTSWELSKRIISQ